MNSATAMDDYPIGEFVSVFTGNELFLADHIIQGRKILPGAAYLELSRAAIALSVTITDKNIIALKESIFIQPIIVSAERAVTVKIYPGVNGEFGVEVCTEQGIHFQSKAYIQPRNEEGLLPQGGIMDIASMEARCQLQGPSKQEFYTNFKNKGINLGASHKGIESIKLGTNCAFITTHLPGSSNRGMDLDPGMLDCFIQSAAVMARNLEEGVRLPFAVQSTRIFGPLTDRMCAFLTKEGENVDYVIADAQGHIKVVINGFVGRELETQDQLVYYKPIIQEESIHHAIDNPVVVEGQLTYTDLVKAVVEAAREMIKDNQDSNVLEVRLPANKPSWQGVLALLKTISLEHPRITYRLKSGNTCINSQYHVVSMDDAPVYSWPDNKTILITGGLGGLGKLFASDIAATSQNCTLILTGRTRLDEAKRTFIKGLENSGVTVIYTQCDVCNKTEVENLVKAHPQINGVIHASGVLMDNFINKKSLAEIEQVLAPKVQGLEFLDEATATLKLDYFITLSSIAGAVGNAGQADYAAANGYMDAYIHNRAEQVRNRQRFGKSISINWPLWESEGMQIDEATKKNFYQVFKVKPMPAAQGLLALRRIIASDYPQLVVLYGNRKAIDSMFHKPTATNRKPAPSNTQEKNVSADATKLVKIILQEVRTITAEHIKRQPQQLDESADWAEFGFDSILLASLVNRFNSQFNLSLMPTIFFEATNMLLFSQYLLENHSEKILNQVSSQIGEKPQQDQPSATTNELESDTTHADASVFARSLKKNYKEASNYREKDIAIIGISCRIAGVRNLRDFWKMLDEERDMITEIPHDRWNWRDYPESSKWGSFIDGVSEFDSLFFGISPVEATYINPEQRLIMQYVWECIENAGCGGNITRGTNTGVFIGCGPSAYTELLSCMPVEAYTATGEVPSVGPNRISYFMDWHGPSNPVETACSSALVAVHRAVEAIRAGHCDQAVAGGVNLLLTPHAYISFSKAGMLAADGRCKTFSDKADGYTRGEGVGMIMLKPLKKAIRDGNSIYAVVKGTAENHGGRTNSLTAPNPKSQSAVIKKAVRDADIDFSRVSYVECHGTGTGLGDPVEINGLKTVANDLLKDKQTGTYCKLGSIKSNIGHLEFAAGIVGIIKVILQMQHKKIARSLHCENINPYIDLKGTHFTIAQQASDWTVAPGQTRIAGVSSFGFGGVNAHVILEEYQGGLSQQPAESLHDMHGAPHLLTFSARNEQSLFNYVAQFPDLIDSLQKDKVALKDIAYTLQMGRSEMQERLVFIARSWDDWAVQMDEFLSGKNKSHSKNIFRGTVKTNTLSSLELGDTESGKNYIKQLLEYNETEKIAELWVRGTKIDWSVLYE